MKLNPKIFLTCILMLLFSSGCLASPLKTSQPQTAGLIDAQQATAIAVVNATFRAPTATLAPAPTSLPPTSTASPVPRPSLTPTASFASCIHPGGEIETGQVTSVVDGSIIKVNIAGQEYRVRYIGLHTPQDTEIKEPFGAEATAKNRELVEGKTITLIKEVSEKDGYGNLLRYVFAGSTFVNEELIRLGLASAVSEAPDTGCFATFLQAETAANAKQVGLWSKPASTITPLGLGIEHVTPGACNCFNQKPKCSDFSSHNEAQACYDQCVSIGMYYVFRLIDNPNGQACTKLP